MTVHGAGRDAERVGRYIVALSVHHRTGAHPAVGPRSDPARILPETEEFLMGAGPSDDFFVRRPPAAFAVDDLPAWAGRPIPAGRGVRPGSTSRAPTRPR